MQIKYKRITRKQESAFFNLFLSSHLVLYSFLLCFLTSKLSSSFVNIIGILGINKVIVLFLSFFGHTQWYHPWMNSYFQYIAKSQERARRRFISISDHTLAIIILLFYVLVELILKYKVRKDQGILFFLVLTLENNIFFIFYF